VGDIAKKIPGAIQRDNQMAKARKELDWIPRKNYASTRKDFVKSGPKEVPAPMPAPCAAIYAFTKYWKINFNG